MALATSNRDGGRTNEAGHLRALVKGFTGDVLTGLAVAQRAAGANMSVDIAIGDAIIRRSDGTYGHPVWNDAVYNQSIAPADAANPRNDIVVVYVDYGEVPTTTVSNNTNGVVKIKVVSGAAAGSPVDPTDTTIQSSVGAGNPYTKLARVRVAAGATSIGNSVIDDLRDMASAILKSGGVLGANIAPSAVTASKIATDAVTTSKLVEAFLKGRRQDNTTNSTVSGYTIQTGWGFVLGDGDDTATKAVTFPVAFTQAPLIVSTGLGTKSGSDPTSSSDFPTLATINMNPSNVSLTGFTAVVNDTRGIAQGTTIRMGFSWIAIGIV